MRVGATIAVTGTVGINADGTFPKTAGEQTRRALQIIQAAIEALGGRLDDVVRTRMFVTDISQWEAVGAVHGEIFGTIRPATTMVEVAKLIDAAALVESKRTRSSANAPVPATARPTPPRMSHTLRRAARAPPTRWPRPRGA